MSEPYFSEEDKIRQGHTAFKSFFDSLGPNDIYKQILLETFFEFLYKSNNLEHILEDHETKDSDNKEEVKPLIQPEENLG